MSRPRTWTDDDLRRAAAASRSLREVATRLGLHSSGGAKRTIHRHARRLGIDLPLAKRRSWSDNDLRQAVATSASMRQVAAALGLSRGTWSVCTIRIHADRLGLTLPQGKAGRPRNPEDRA